ncbi:NAD-dependent epimerase/dehydratase family protein [Desulfolutivibrio sulfoxidireducens]|uniref:NAD-dependent epimerase/dehydratase family protein n=1 Tax=Desulfolutivibrio sulfoxidireducens TaxID=2773299 RepID=UPI00159E8513|nr:NAD-dependent epimerase/dehydratase family protein [Desulfolutivibrio sulfoxidireducens]
MKHATVFGARGFIGSHLVRRLRLEGVPTETPARDDLGQDGRPLGHVFYCLGLTSDYMRRPLETIEAHVCLLREILQRGNFESLIYLSSTRLYDGCPSPASETTPLALDPANPRHLFDLSKALGEAACRAAPNRRCVTARLSSVYSDQLDSDNFLHQIIRRTITEPALSLETSRTLARDYVHVDDVCDALIRIAESASYDLYNVASGVNLSNEELFLLLEGETGRHIQTKNVDRSSVSPGIDIARLCNEFQYSPTPPKEGIRRIVKNLISNQQGDMDLSG